MKPFSKITGIALFTAFSMLSVASCRDYDPSVDNDGKDYPRVGDYLPVMKLTTTEGKTLSYGQLADGNTLLVFFDLGCPDCIDELPVIEAFSMAHSAQVRTIAVGRGHTDGEITDYWQSNALSVTACADPEGTIYGLFASSGVPHVVAASDGEIMAVLPDAGGILPSLRDLEDIFGLKDNPSEDPSDNPSPDSYPKVGDNLPEISFITCEGVKISFKYICSDSTLLYFFGLDNEASLHGLSVINSFSESLTQGTADLKVFAVEVGHDKDAINAYWQTAGVNLIACSDIDGKAYAKVSDSPLPCTVAVRDGKVMAIYTARDGGMPSAEELKSIFGLNGVPAGKPL